MKRKLLSLMLALAMLLSLNVTVLAADGEGYDGTLRIENGLLQPMLNYSDPRDPAYDNAKSDILRFCVYVETDHDTDNDGKADLVKAFVQVPRGAVEGKYKAGVIYDPTPYGAGTYGEDHTKMYREVAFNYRDLYRKCEKRTPAGEMSSMDAALAARPAKDWNYSVPISGGKGYSYIAVYDYYLTRGYAVVEASGIGTYGSEGFELCGSHLERDSHVAVVEWLAGNRRAFTDKKNNIEIKADWSNGKVAMTGCSYGGTLPFEVATTGVKGLATIIPYAGIASWYDYTNSQGVPIVQNSNYMDLLAAFNCGGTFLDRDWTVSNKEYGSWLWQIGQDQIEANGNYASVWEESNYAKDWQNIKCSALIVHGLNDFNVTTKQSNLMVQAFQKAGQAVKVVWHQDGHNIIYNTMVNGELWDETQNRWLAHYLFDVDNGAEKMPNVLAQSNLDGSWKAYDSWKDFRYTIAPVSYSRSRTVVTSRGLADYATPAFMSDVISGGERCADYYLNLPERNGAAYDLRLKSGTTVYGAPEVHVRLSSEVMDYEGLMITAVLMDVADNGSEFDAFMLKDRLSQTLPVRAIGEFEGVGCHGNTEIFEYVQDSTPGKAISYGWTDLTNPGGGTDLKDYAETAHITAGEFYDYTFYMLPTVYTVAPGHHLELILTTWDPYRAFLDLSAEQLGFVPDNDIIDYDYSYIIDNDSLQVRLPVAGK